MASRRWSHGGPVPAIAFGLALSLGGAGSVEAAPSFEGQGRVTAIDPGRSTVTIEHGGIPALRLPASQSEFPVQSAAVLQDVRSGDRVRFTLSAADESHGLLTVVSLSAEAPRVVGVLEHGLVSVAVALGLLTLAAVAATAVLLWRDLQTLHRRVIALDHEAGMLRGLVTETRDGVGQITKALDEAVTALRVGYVRELGRRLASGTAGASAEAAGDRAPGEAAQALVIVQRGRGELYRAVEGGAAGAGFAVIWDRRRNERRRSGRRAVGHERRHGERRGSPPETWTQLGFQLVPAGIEAMPAPRLLRPVSGERGAPR